MQIKNLALFAGAASAATSICDKYTTALLKNNTGANQYTLLTLLVNTVVIGNYTGTGSKNPTLPGSMNAVPGILAPGTVNGEAVNLLPYFDGGLVSTNMNGKAGVQNFLDGGGATPIIADPTSSGTKGSNQYFLLTHLYQFFGVLLGCSEYGMSGFPAYQGVPSMYTVHKYMDLSEAELSYFIEQVGLAATSFGASMSDVTTVAGALNSTFGYKCAPPAKIVPADGPLLQAICVASDCPTATASATCGAYAAETEPATVSMSASASASAMSMSVASASVYPTSSAVVSQISDGQVQATTAVTASYTGAAAALMTPGALAALAGMVAAAL